MVPEASISTFCFLHQHPPLQGTLHTAAAWDFFLKQTCTMSLPCLETYHGPSLPSGKAPLAKISRIRLLWLQPLICIISHDIPYSRVRAPAISCLSALASAVPSAWKALLFFSIFLRGLSFTSSVKLSLIHPYSHLLCPFVFYMQLRPFCCSLCLESSSLYIFLRGLNVTSSTKLSLIHLVVICFALLYFTCSWDPYNRSWSLSPIMFLW